jgi:hypothetical protein
MFRFTIRDVLWLTVVVGLALGWWNQSVKHRAELLSRDLVIDDISSSGVWHDNKGRILQVHNDARGHLQVVPYAKDGRVAGAKAYSPCPSRAAKSR